MKKAIFTLALMLSAFAGNAQTSLRGDVNNDGTVSLSDIMLLVDIILYEDATQAYTACPDNNHPHLIDLGLPSSTKWSCCNVGASKPEAYGGYYAWGETQEKSLYDYTTYKNTIDKNGDNITDNDEMNLQRAREILESDEFYQYVQNIGIHINGNSVRITSKDIENYRF